jgi:hypothetical protein
MEVKLMEFLLIFIVRFIGRGIVGVCYLIKPLILAGRFIIASIYKAIYACLQKLPEGLVLFIEGLVLFIIIAIYEVAIGPFRGLFRGRR